MWEFLLISIIQFYVNYVELFIIFAMYNKKVRPVPKQSSQQLQTICEYAFQNKQNLQAFYIKNKTKFPPILQSRQIVLNTITPNYSQSNSFRFNNNNKQASDDNQGIIGNNILTQNKPRICHIVFQKGDRKRRRKSLLLHQNKYELQKSPIGSLQKNASKRMLFHQKNKQLKFLNDPLSNQIDLSKMLNSFQVIKPRVRVFNRVILSQTLQPQSLNNKTQDLDKSLVVGNALALNPQNQFIQTLQKSRGDLLNQQQSLFKKRDQLHQSRISFYKYADGILKNGKKKIENYKDIYKFEPWQIGSSYDQLLPEQFMTK